MNPALLLAATLALAPADRMQLADKMFAKGLYSEAVREYRAIGGAKTVSADDLAALEKVLKESMDGDEPALVIAYAPCRIAAKLTKAGLCKVDESKCKACGACFKLGCPAISRGEEVRKGAYKMVIDPNQCAGCIQCSQVCKFGAIVRVK
jgi:indolepyruvate ferredoxin oxidoreductase alpha subunit